MRHILNLSFIALLAGMYLTSPVVAETTVKTGLSSRSDASVREVIVTIKKHGEESTNSSFSSTLRL